MEIEKKSKKPYLIDRKKAAQILGVSLSQIERLRRDGLLPYVKIPKNSIRYKLSDINALIDKWTIDGRFQSNDQFDSWSDKEEVEPKDDEHMEGEFFDEEL